jgi:hypothetical protein
MKKISIILFTICALLYSCSKDDIIPATPVVPATTRKLYFHCNKHNLSYRFDKYILDEYKDLVMPCPECYSDSSFAFMKKNRLSEWQILCPIDSTWTTYYSDVLNYKNITEWSCCIDHKTTTWFPDLKYDYIKKNTIETLQYFIKDSPTGMFLNSLPDFWCKTCFNKLCLSAITLKQDSITTNHNLINGITGISFTTYPVNTGVPPDRRVRALAILDSIERIMPTLDNSYNKEYNSINRFIGVFNNNRQRYIYSKKTGTAINSYVSEDVAFNKVSADEYISDTVIINIGGGPDYRLDGEGVVIPLFKTKSSSYTIQSVKSLQTNGHKDLVHGVKTKSNRSKVDGQYQLSTDFVPGNIDFLPSQYLPRKYNTYTTSEFIIFHPQKGNQLMAFNGKPYTWNFVDLAKTVGGYNNKFPYNISNVYNAEVMNDIGTMEIRKVVEWCKARGKKMVLMGSSWGGAMIFNYLLYYPSTDFEHIVIADQNPNMQEAIVAKEMEDYIYGAALIYGADPNYKEINKNMCVISIDTYRRMNWLKNQNLSNTTFFYGAHDDNVGNIPANDISILKSQGAKIFKFPDACHGVFHDYRVWYRYWTPVQM